MPQADYSALQAEIDVLREDHLNTLRREVEARMSALHALGEEKKGGDVVCLYVVYGLFC